MKTQITTLQQLINKVEELKLLHATITPLSDCITNVRYVIPEVSLNVMYEAQIHYDKKFTHSSDTLALRCSEFFSDCDIYAYSVKVEPIDVSPFDYKEVNL